MSTKPYSYTSRDFSHMPIMELMARPAVWFKTGIVALLAQYHHWRSLRDARDAFLTLLRLDDVVLHDLGYCREELIAFTRLPLRVNAAKEMEKLRKRRNQGLYAFNKARQHHPIRHKHF